MPSTDRSIAGSAAEVVARTEALIPALRGRAAAVDELRQMPPESVADLKAAGVARLQPKRRKLATKRSDVAASTAG